MKETLEILRTTSVGLLVVAAIAYFLKVYIEKRIEGLAGRTLEIAKTSLDMKKGLRTEERAELLAFRVAVETWEYSLQTLLFDFTMLAPTEAQIMPFYTADKSLFLDVKIAVVRVSTYLRNQELEQQLMAAVDKIRKTYYPLINETMPRLIDLQSRMIPLALKMKRFEESGLLDMASAPTPKDREDNLALETELTAEVSNFAQNLAKEYGSIAAQMNAVKEAVNHYLYRPVTQTRLDVD